MKAKPLFRMILNYIYMEITINERFKMLMRELDYKSVRAFAAKIGVSQTSFNDIINGAEPKYSTIFKVLKAEPNINAEWLMTGEGEMLKSNISPLKPDDNDAANVVVPKAVLDMLQKQTQTILSQQSAIENLSLKTPATADNAKIAGAGS
jgi:hypothetical protein